MREGRATPAPSPGGTLAAVDLGSNSFHLALGCIAEGRAVIVERMKEMVQLGAGLDHEQVLSEASQRRALACLKRFARCTQSLPEENVRAVGTNALRVARNVDRFLTRAQETLGHPIEVISGIEEARLIYAGVLQERAKEGERLLVVDIGGGSTELVVGKGSAPRELESLYVGCISMMKRHFENGQITARTLRAAEMTALQELERCRERFRRVGWSAAVGTSGTVRAVSRVLRRQGWSDGLITSASLSTLRNALIRVGSVDGLSLKGLRRSRARVFPGGVAILSAVFEMLEIDTLEVSNGALREGLLSDLLGRVLCRDVRTETVNALMERYRVDKGQAHRVESTLLGLLAQVSEVWALPQERSQQLCAWASRLHEIGLDVAHSHYHKHGAYLIAHGDMPGFSRQEQGQLAALVRAHRRKFPSTVWKEFPGSEHLLEQLAVLLRLATLLHRSRSHACEVGLRGGPRSLEVEFPPGWLERHPLVQVDLLEEAEVLRAAGFQLRILK